MRLAGAVSGLLFLLVACASTPQQPSATPRESAAPSASAAPPVAAAVGAAEPAPAAIEMRLVRFEQVAVEVEVEAARVVNADFNGYYAAVYLSGGSGLRVVDAKAPYPSNQAEAESHAEVYGAVEQHTEQLADGFLIRGTTDKHPRHVVLAIRRVGDKHVFCDGSGETEAQMAYLVELCKALRPIGG